MRTAVVKQKKKIKNRSLNFSVKVEDGPWLMDKMEREILKIVLDANEHLIKVIPSYTYSMTQGGEVPSLRYWLSTIIDSFPRFSTIIHWYPIIQDNENSLIVPNKGPFWVCYR